MHPPSFWWGKRMVDWYCVWTTGFLAGKTCTDVFLLLQIEEWVNTFSRAQWFSTLDLAIIIRLLRWLRWLSRTFPKLSLAPFWSFWIQINAFYPKHWCRECLVISRVCWWMIWWCWPMQIFIEIVASHSRLGAVLSLHTVVCITVLCQQGPTAHWIYVQLQPYEAWISHTFGKTWNQTIHPCWNLPCHHTVCSTSRGKKAGHSKMSGLQDHLRTTNARIVNLFVGEADTEPSLNWDQICFLD